MLPDESAAAAHPVPPIPAGRARLWEAAIPPDHLPIIARCLRRIATWRLPPNWSAFDWLEEVREVLCVAAIEAETDFDSARGLPFGAFLYYRALARVLTRYRQEWNYGTRFLSECAGSCICDEEEPDPQEYRLARSRRIAVEIPFLQEPDIPLEELAEALASLTKSSRRLIDLLFWEEYTESEAGRDIGISQPCISRRKQAILQTLRCRMTLQK
jgi:RNA polymerase sigma factor (sigma-70 family)